MTQKQYGAALEKNPYGGRPKIITIIFHKRIDLKKMEIVKISTPKQKTKRKRCTYIFIGGPGTYVWKLLCFYCCVCINLAINNNFIQETSCSSVKNVRSLFKQNLHE
jgi:hypothetical protein